jgi:hypothetical protein
VSDGATVTPSGTCKCGNSAAVSCNDCRAPVCSLCARTFANGPICLACRSSALKREDERASRSRLGKTSKRSLQIRRTWVYVPAIVVGSVAAVGTLVGSLLAEAAGARSERRAREALMRIVDAEKRYHVSTPAFVSLERLVDANLVAPSVIPGYALRVEIAKDGHTFWARAVPLQDGLRGMTADAQGAVVYDGGGE